MEPNASKDAADLAFEKLLYSEGGYTDIRNKVPHVDTISSEPPSISDDVFDALLEEFKRIGSAADSELSSAENSEDVDRSMMDDADVSSVAHSSMSQFARLGVIARDLARHIDAQSPPALRDAFRALQEYVLENEVDRYRDMPDMYLLGASSGQIFALELQAVHGIEMHKTYTRNVANGSQSDKPRFLNLALWWRGIDKLSAHMGPQVTVSRGLSIVFEQLIGVALLRAEPLGRLLEGSIGLKALAQTDDYSTVMVLDIDGLLSV